MSSVFKLFKSIMWCFKIIQLFIFQILWFKCKKKVVRMGLNKCVDSNFNEKQVNEFK